MSEVWQTGLIVALAVLCVGSNLAHAVIGRRFHARLQNVERRTD